MLRVVRIEAEVVRGEDVLQEAIERVLAAWPAPTSAPTSASASTSASTPTRHG
jgi:hypothetical protein